MVIVREVVLLVLRSWGVSVNHGEGGNPKVHTKRMNNFELKMFHDPRVQDFR